MSDDLAIPLASVAGAVAMKIFDWALKRFGKKEDTLDAVVVGLAEVKASVDLARQEFRAGLSALTEKHTRLEQTQEHNRERLEKGLGNHSQRLATLEEKVTRVETQIDERIPRRPV